ncbi:replication initiation protein RepC [Loktanella atrilutea]|uniref:Replication initiation protein RepC n=1 Tax=Loktanella atrilutea TaxID=366533 RepID=A0A1M5EB68_LOKAT|nr:helix-turn-helix domain-containing protein [Loktanella atrilutea]SHF76479.1 replication initiation protein RepC [Loktanella atrilutea]
MYHHPATALEAGAQSICAVNESTAFDGVGTVAQQPYFHPIRRRDLLAAVNTAAKDLGLRPASVVVIDALLSCLPCRDPKTGIDNPITPLTLLTVYAANATLCFRAKGITDRQLRRHLETLENVGLISRKDSANGKRFPIQRSGKVIGAFGIDLSPLLARSAEIIDLAQQRRDDAAELRGMRSCIQSLRMACLDLDVDKEITSFLDSIRNVLRRATTTVIEARAIIFKLKGIIADTCAVKKPDQTLNETTVNVPVEPSCVAQKQNAEPQETSATDGRNDRHKEPPKSYTKKTLQSLTDLWQELTHIRSFYPEIPRSDHHALQIVHEFGKILRINPNVLASGIASNGWRSALEAQNEIAARVATIADPTGYFRSLLKTGARLSQMFIPDMRWYTSE